MNQDRSPDLDRLWSDVPVGTPDLAGAVRRGDRARRGRQTFGAVAAGAVLLAATVVGTSAWPHGTTPTPTPAPDVADGTATLYYLLPEPVPEGEVLGERATLLTPREVEVAGTGDPAYDALHHLMSTEAPEGLLSAVMQPEPANQLTIDVVDVTHREGLVTVELTRDPYDPCPVCSLVLTYKGESVAQAWAMTVQDALGTDDPVSFVADGRPVDGVWMARVDDPVVADRDLVLPADDPLDLATSGWVPGDPAMGERLEGVLARDRRGCVVVRTDEGPTYPVWPAGWRAWDTGQGLVLTDAQANISARERQSVVVRGFEPAFVDLPGCEPERPTPVFFVQSALSIIR